MNRSGEAGSLRQAIQTIQRLNAEIDSLRQARCEPIAVVGVGCRFPGGANGPDAFWDMLSEGRCVSGDVPPERWDAAAYHDADPDAPGKMYTRRGGFLHGIDQFDADFFGIAPREAAAMDPQQRLLLEVAWEALEHAAWAPEALSGSRTGVYIGINSNEYYQMAMVPGRAVALDAYSVSGGVASVAAGRISFLLGLHGPSLAVDTACSSSLVAVHLAMQGLRNRDCDRALVGGVYLVLRPELSIALCKLRMLSPDGLCKTFDARADGFVQGEGCGVIVLRRLCDALAAGDRVLAVLRGSAVNQDGKSAGLTAPNGPAQEAVLRAALADAGLAPSDVDYVEAHGTGTSLGDPIEVRALAAVLGPGRAAGHPLRLGAVKTNIGHTGPAAGLSGLIKVVLMLQRGAIPPTLHLREPNPLIPWPELPLNVPTSLLPWSGESGGRRAGVSSFGFSGTNAHVIVAEAPAMVSPVISDDRRHLLTLSARTPAALRVLASYYADFLDGPQAPAWTDVCFTAATGRTHFEHRLALIACDVHEAALALRAFYEGNPLPGLSQGRATSGQPPRVVFGYPNETNPAVSLKTQIEHFQAWTASWRQWGIEPVAVLGHGHGLFAAGSAAGVFTNQDALRFADAVGQSPETLLSALTSTPLVAPRLRLIACRSVQPAPGDWVGPEFWRAVLAETGSPEPGLREAEARGCDILLTPEGAWNGLSGDRLDILAALYVRGARIDWLGGMRDHPGRKVSLPTYPFQRVHCWRDESIETIEVSKQETLLGERSPSPLREVQFASRINLASLPYLEDHQVFGRVVVPGACYLSLGLAAGAETLGTESLDLEGVTFPHALVLGKEETRPLQTVLTPAADGTYRVDVFSLPSPAGPWEQHASGRLRRRTTPIAQPTGWKDAARQEQKGDAEQWARAEWVSKLESIGVRIGPAFQGIETIERRAGEALAVVTAPESLARDSGNLAFHPALLDACLQVLGAAFLDGMSGSAYLPLGMERWCCLSRPGKTLRCHAQIRSPDAMASETVCGDLTIRNEAGELVAFAEGLTARRVAPTALSDQASQDLYHIDWQLQHQPRHNHNLEGNWLLVGNGDGLAERLERLLQARGGRGQIIASAAQVNDSKSQGARIGVDSVVRGVVCLTPLATASKQTDNGELTTNPLPVCGEILRLVHTLAAAAEIPPLWIVTRSAQAVGGTFPSPGQAPTWGLGSVIAAEYPACHCTMIDLDSTTPEQAAEAILSQLGARDQEDQVVIRNGQRWVPRLKRGSGDMATAEFRPDPNGNYLIAGGLSGLGLETARWLIDHGARHLMLIGRRPPIDLVAAQVRAWAATGVQVQVRTADIAVATDVARVLADIEAGPAPLRGVIHSAGVRADGVLPQLTEEQFARVLAAKVQGGWNLHRQTLGQPLHLFVLFGSIASFIGAKGQANYAAANAFLAGLAHFRRARHLPGLCIDWGPWSEVGMAAALGTRVSLRLAGLGIGSLSPDEGRSLLGKLFGSTLERVGVLPRMDWVLFGQQFPEGELPAFLSQVVPEQVPARASVNGFLHDLHEVEPDERARRLCHHVSLRAASVLGHDDGPLDPERPLSELGLDSLMAVELRNHLRNDLGVALPLERVLQGPCVRRLVDGLLEQLSLQNLLAPASSPAAAVPDGGWEVLEL